MPTLEEYTVGWICALSTEHVAARAFLDELHENQEYRAPGDDNDYTLGIMKGHNVVIAVMPDGEYGIASAASVAKDMCRTFTSLKVRLMVGIGGGAPSERHDIRLGDVVVSSPRDGKGGVLQYDFGKLKQGQELQMTGFLNQPPRSVRTAVNGLKSEYETDGHKLEAAIEQVLLKKPRLRKKYQRPSSETDKLFHSSFTHLHDESSCSEICKDDGNNLVLRDKREADSVMIVHHGLMASANALMKDAIMRDKLSREIGIICFEMEAAGLMNDFDCLVIRGICDYADTHKNKDWQGYAAMAAAAYAKDLLARIAPMRISVESNGHNTARLNEEEKAKDRKKLLDSLLADDFDYTERLAIIEERLNGTCEWFCQHPNFEAWLRRGDVLLVSAEAGCGKSVLAKYLIEEVLPQEDPQATICYFFFKDDSPQTRSFKNASTALLHRLFASNDDLANIWTTKFSKSPGVSFQKTWNDFCEASVDPVDPAAGRVICVIDALDESNQDQRGDFLKGVRDHLKRCSRRNRVKFLFTTRGYLPIKEHFYDFSSDMIVHLDGDNDDEKDHIQAEIDKVMNHRLDKLFNKRSDLSSHTRRLIEAGFYQHGSKQRTYLWMHLVFEVIKKDRPTLRADWREIFEITPDKIAKAYEKLLQGVENRYKEKVRSLLAIVIAAQQPLTLDELNIALAAREGISKPRNWDVYEELETSPEFRSWMEKQCGSFLTIYNKTVYLIHQTAKEFLMKSSLESTSLGDEDAHHGRWAGSLRYHETHRYMAESCVSLLSLDQFHSSEFLRDVQSRKRPRGKNESNEGSLCRPFLAYAVKFWLDHFKHCQHQPKALGVVFDIEQDFIPAYHKLFSQKGRRSHRTHGEKKQAWYYLMMDALPAGTFPHEYPVANSLRRLFPYSYNVARTACLFGHWRLLKFAVEELKAEIEYKPDEVVSTKTANVIDVRYSLAHFAAYGGSDFCLQYLKDLGCSMDIENRTGQTPLHEAAARGLVSTTVTLIRLGATPAQRDATQRTPLIFAMTTGDGRSNLTGLVKTLNGTAPTGYNETINIFKSLGGNDKIRSLLYFVVMARPSSTESQSEEYKTMFRELRKRPKAFTKSKAFAAAYENSTIKALKELGAVLDLPLHRDMRVLHFSVGEPDRLCNAAFLLHAGADVHVVDDLGNTPLHTATRAGNYAAFKLLVAYGADVDRKGGNGKNIGDCPLHIASKIRNKEVAKALLWRNASPEVRNSDGLTALQVDEIEDGINLTQLIREQGQKPHQTA